MCSRVCAHLCLQGLSSPWSPWEVVGRSPNCPKDIGYDSSSNLQSGEIKIKEVCMCVFARAILCVHVCILYSVYEYDNWYDFIDTTSAYQSNSVLTPLLFPDELSAWKEAKQVFFFCVSATLLLSLSLNMMSKDCRTECWVLDLDRHYYNVHLRLSIKTEVNISKNISI